MNNIHPRAKIILDRIKENTQVPLLGIDVVISEVLLSAQFASVEETVKEIYNTKIQKNDTLIKYRNRIIRNVNKVKAIEC